MTEPFIGQIMAVGFNFAPRGWAMCNGQLLSISQNTALFSLLGTTYGGNGQTTFALPDLRGRVSLHVGAGPGLSSRQLGEVGGTEAHTLLTANLPNHSHTVTPRVASGDQTTNRPGSGVPARGGVYGTADADGAVLNSGPVGSSTPVGHMPPYLVLNWIIALQGIFPSRN